MGNLERVAAGLVKGISPERDKRVFFLLPKMHQALVQASFGGFFLMAAAECIHDYRFKDMSLGWLAALLILISVSLLMVFLPKMAPYFLLKSLRVLVIITAATIFLLFKNQTFDWIWSGHFIAVVIAFISVPSQIKYYKLRKRERSDRPV